jgi:hypothetical protein
MWESMPVLDHTMPVVDHYVDNGWQQNTTHLPIRDLHTTAEKAPHEMTEQDYRPIKRIRQACRNCRRKKARCTGERPECAFCVRLKQPCSYSDGDSPPASTNMALGRRKSSVHFADSVDEDHVSTRISMLENQMEEVVRTLRG